MAATNWATFILTCVQVFFSFAERAKNKGCALESLRQLAVKMGLHDNIYEMTPNDIRCGHRRVYDFSSISEEVENADFRIVATEGFFNPL